MQNYVRIIAGKFKQRKIYFKFNPHLRPTADRTKETLFNWLGNLANKRCLDLYAGTGSLGFEAASRGGLVWFNDTNSKHLDNIKHMANTLNLPANFWSYHIPKQKELKQYDGEVFDVVFIDPPFAQDLIKPSIAWLMSHKLINHETILYLESAEPLSFDDFNMLKSKTSKNYHYGIGHIL